jgi:hypothetical protein
MLGEGFCLKSELLKGLIDQDRQNTTKYLANVCLSAPIPERNLDRLVSVDFINPAPAFPTTIYVQAGTLPMT